MKTPVSVPVPAPRHRFWRALPAIRAGALLAFVIALFFLRDGATPASSVFAWTVALLALLAAPSLPRLVARPFTRSLALLPYAGYLVALTIAWRLHPDAPGTSEFLRQLAFLATVGAVACITAQTGPAPWVAATLVCLSLIVVQILGPSSMFDHFGRGLNYSAIEQWSGYPEIGLLASLGAGAAGALMLGGPGLALRVAGALLASGFVAGVVFLYSRFSVLTAAAVIAWLTLVCLARWRRMAGVAVLVPLLAAGAWVAAGQGETPARVRAAIDARLGAREVGIRAEGWRVAQAMMRDAPWFGVGPGRYASEYAQYSKQGDATHAYNIVLHTGADLGWVGLTMYLALWVRVAWISLAAAFARVQRRAEMAERAAALATHAMLVAFFVRSQSEHFLANLTTSFRLLLLVGLLFGLAEGARARRRSSSRASAGGAGVDAGAGAGGDGDAGADASVGAGAPATTGSASADLAERQPETAHG
jgi:hypothetical protein